MAVNLKEYLPYIKSFFVGCCFFLLLVGYQTTQNFQSGVNKTDGYISIALVYGCYGISQFFTPFLVHILSPKFSLYFAGVCYVFYIATNVHLLRPLYFIASALCGFGASLIWSASAVLLSGYEQGCKHPSYIYTFFFVPVYFNFFGNVIPLFVNPSEPALLFLVLTAISAIAVVLMLFTFDSPPTPVGSLKELLFSTIKNFINWRLILLFPLALVFGFSRSYYYATMPVMAPIEMTPYIFISFGAMMTISTFIWGFLNSKLTEQWTLLIAMTAEAIVVILGIVANEVYLKGATEAPSDEVGLNIMICVVGMFGGIADSGMETITTALINKIWPKQVAPLCAWRVVYLGFMCADLLYSPYISFRAILIVLGVIVFFGLICNITIALFYKKIYKPIEEQNHKEVSNKESLLSAKQDEKVKDSTQVNTTQDEI
ncbi:hypothetical protein EIN_250320 [Entamoeba invadens IP1]|uniref:UNC93-like protein MFSD11 n=1 Tax=Entamoeba invadens IP1 TaxID=370355 RepID=A0A0A1UEM0_ENTIV|nr:hypothetical protein EIN_250320 [Entamoeba invadens IP1]ELP94938.1 hypothetical protein EIN_250320 [Entamoeba invadens IP1]|eukprot:XP_004261709.1 hypothetical protein EIN_250320 [Entamoeba invadens IP1]